MADKTSTSGIGIPPQQGLITTAGSIGVNSVQIIFDEDTPTGILLDLIERAKIQIVAYYLKK